MTTFVLPDIFLQQQHTHRQKKKKKKKVRSHLSTFFTRPKRKEKKNKEIVTERIINVDSRSNKK
jgi:hypothetical protein